MSDIKIVFSPRAKQRLEEIADSVPFLLSDETDETADETGSNLRNHNQVSSQ